MIDSRLRLEYYGREFLTDRDGLPGRKHINKTTVLLSKILI